MQSKIVPKEDAFNWNRDKKPQQDYQKKLACAEARADFDLRALFDVIVCCCLGAAT